LLTGILIISSLAFTDDEHTEALVQLQLLIGLVLMIASHVLRALYKHFRFLNLSTIKLVAMVLVAGFFFSAISQLIIQGVIYGLLSWSEIQEFSLVASVMYWFNTSVILIVWSVLYIGIRTYESRRKQEVENWKLRAELREAELAMLKAQINPHFLFNALNNVRSLISENTAVAREMISALSDLLRYAISHTSGDLVTVSEELEIVKQYVSLEKMQYEDRLNVRFDINKQTEQCTIPPMVIQMLVENAIKHGVSLQPTPGTIEVRTAISDHLLTVIVINEGLLNSSKAGGGIGLSNIKKRLSHRTDEDWTFTLKQISDSKVESKIKIPCRNQANR
jgi:LytS/YehU family sensor histidine kinase